MDGILETFTNENNAYCVGCSQMTMTVSASVSKIIWKLEVIEVREFLKDYIEVWNCINDSYFKIYMSMMSVYLHNPV